MSKTTLLLCLPLLIFILTTAMLNGEAKKLKRQNEAQDSLIEAQQELIDEMAVYEWQHGLECSVFDGDTYTKVHELAQRVKMLDGER